MGYAASRGRRSGMSHGTGCLTSCRWTVSPRVAGMTTRPRTLRRGIALVRPWDPALKSTRPDAFVAGNARARKTSGEKHLRAWPQARPGALTAKSQPAPIVPSRQRFDAPGWSTPRIRLQDDDPLPD